MVKIIVQRPVIPNSLGSDVNGATIWGEGLNTIEPTVSLTPAIKAAFAVGAQRVHFKGPEFVGDFKLADDWVEVELRHGRLVLVRTCLYEFQGWVPRSAET